MAMVAETLGLALPGSAMLPAVYVERLRAGARAPARRDARSLRDGGPLPRELVTRKSARERLPPRSPRPAARPTPACTCRRSRTRPASASRSTTSPTCSQRTPLIADLQPGGRFLAKDLHRVGGVPSVLKALLDGGAPARRCAHARRAHARRGARRAMPAPTATWCAATAAALHQTGGLVVLKGNLAPDGALIKVAGLKALVFEGPARVFDSEEEAVRRRHRAALRRPATSS